MNAIELSKMIERYNSGVHSQIIVENYQLAVEMLRKQHEAIKTLREALIYASTYVQEDEAERGKPYLTGQVIRKALKDTEEFQ